MNKYEPDQLESACWNIIQPLINKSQAELLRIGYQDAGAWEGQYSVMTITSRQRQGMDEQLGFDDESGEYFYKGQRNGQLTVTFFGARHAERAENLTSRLSTESARDLKYAHKVTMYGAQVLANTPAADPNATDGRWLRASAVVINYRCAYTFSDSVGIIEIVDLTATIDDVTIRKQIAVKKA